MKIGELAKLADCRVVTIRYYEKEGLLLPPQRSGGNYRQYNQNDLERLRFIRHCRKHSMQLSEIRDLLNLKDHPQQSCAWVNTLVEQHISNVSEQIRSLKHLKQHLEQLLDTCSGEHQNGCGIIHSLNSIENCPCSQMGGGCSLEDNAERKAQDEKRCV